MHRTHLRSQEQSIEARHCTIARAPDVVGSRSAFRILREAFYGTTRFEDFAARARVWLGPSGVEMQHHACGGAIRTELRCAEGHPVTPGEIDLVPRPGAEPALPAAEQLH